ncbi:MAG: redox-sensitive transcriptional activator SoxR [Rhodoglobus sp.]|uniref:Redox-sensitive transcriptional activator SoxR n=1 Tax=Microbacterium aurugineum TaxID=2851642 RepID=A0ABY4IXC2_9MICO|nr:MULTISPECIES: redox-sensitive transcriptional activator SoxR [Microbacterium]MDZ4044455.1 redox-sensitive transcriptional activator SoxR [Rhodoglobus sp.]PKQ36170.1 MAG: redox-sensitive transcriptional activator SoxR [Actinobacteria bacterium HGW-Actinobacteria-11]MCE0510775.1 redox-sensitive transcriptional activator SoxR [Microbacterium sp. KKR3/1]MCK8467986.1 redox-sensitive transcriptional activator SoxR [Microbacterium aurugineum]MCK8475532.1 redox-sensitive transcriptional activator S
MSLEPDDLLAIGEVVRRTGVPATSLHFYEQLGLISSTRTAGNQRRYRRHMLRRISLIVVAKRLGIPLTDVHEVFQSLPADESPSQRDWQRVARLWREQLDIRRTQLEHLRREITGCIGCGCLSLKACRLLNPEDALADDGPGPRRI